MARKSVIIRLILVFLLLPAGYAGVDFYRFCSRDVTPPAPRIVSIPSGSSFARVAQLLQDEGVVSSAFRLRLLVRLRGDAAKVKAGEYGFSEPALPGEVLDRLVAGDVRQYRFTVPEGLTMKEIAQRLSAEGLGNGDLFLQLARDPAFIASLGVEATSLEGYLFPETYTLVAGTPERRLIQAMVRQMTARLTPDLLAAAQARGLNAHELVTLASVIQKEAGNESEMPLISAVFHNRLKRGMRLQADPTVIYGIENFNGNLTKKDLLEPTPYNTYRIAGLPPGPISNPGEAALKAAAFPADVNYLYFVGRGDGTHAFSLTLTEHNAAVRRYQLRR